MNREIHVRICESVRVKLPRATRPVNYELEKESAIDEIRIDYDF